MNKFIIEVGSTVTKVDEYKDEKLNRIKNKTILFKKHYKEEHKLNKDDIEELINLTNETKELGKDIYVCGTSIFRDLEEKEKNEFLSFFKNETGFNFNIISAKEESELTVLSATRFINEKSCVFVGGGGSTEITIFDGKILETANSSIGVIDAMEKYPDLNNDIASSNIEEIKSYIKSVLTLPKEKSDILILAGGAHEKFIREARIEYQDNTLYNDINAPIMMDISTRKKETKRFLYEISLDEIKKRVEDPSWWYGARMMCLFVLVVAESIEAKYIIPTNIGMSYGIIEKLKRENYEE